MFRLLTILALSFIATLTAFIIRIAGYGWDLTIMFGIVAFVGLFAFTREMMKGRWEK